MTKFLPLVLLLSLFTAPAFGDSKGVTVEEVPSVIELAVGQEVRRFRLIPQEDEAPRTEEYNPGATPGITIAPATEPKTSRLERLGNIGDILVPLLAALLGATAGPGASTIVSRIWSALRNKSNAPPSATDPLSSVNAVDGVIKIANVLKQLAPVFSAIEQLSKNVPAASTPTDAPAPAVASK